MKIGLLSDTHGLLDNAIFHYFDECDEVWHAGDIGNPNLLDTLKAYKPLRAVYGNIDGHEIRRELKEVEFFTIKGVKVLMTHIGGRPPKYNANVKTLIAKYSPNIFICGHSHILSILRDNELLFLNPGACGNHGFHNTRTIIRFTIQSGKVVNPEVIELNPRILKAKTTI